MGTDRRRWAWGRAASVAIVLGNALATAGAAALARPQEGTGPPRERQAEPKAGARPRAVPRERAGERDEPGGLRLPPAGAQPGDLADLPEGDPLAPADPGAMPADAARPAAPAPAGAAPGATVVPQWPFHYELTLASFDGAPLAARYYPSQQGVAAPVALLVHDLGAGRSGQDFDDPIAELDGQGLAGSLQELGYAVLAIDLRGHGKSPSRGRGGEAMGRMVGDLQAGYRFLLDRHNRRELNLAKLGVVALGEGANLAASWAAAPGGAVSIEGRVSDLAGLALISPRAEAGGRALEPSVSALAPRFPILLEAGAADPNSAEVVRELQAVVERQRLSRVALIEARLSGTNLIRFAPEATRPLLSFLDNVVKIRADEWEPRYNLNPVVFANVRVVNRGEAPVDAEEAADAPPAPPAARRDAGDR